jgi:hypothetical protein
MYKNRVLEFADRYPIVAFFAVPIGMNIGATFFHGMIRKYKTGSAFSGIGAGEEEEEVNPLSGIRTEGGDDLDMMFRAHAPTGPATSDLSEFEQIQPRPEGAPVRYDEKHHDRVFFSTPSYTPNEGISTQTQNANVDQSFVFAGMNGLSKINKW